MNPRIDYAINQNNTLVLRFEHNTRSSEGGVGGFSLPTQEIFNGTKANTVQATETTVTWNKVVVNEVLFQYDESVIDNNANAAFFPRADSQRRQRIHASGGNEQANFSRIHKLYELQEMEHGSQTRQAHHRSLWRARA